MQKISRIVSGGQTGVDRAALDVALEFGISCGGWCPRGRRAVDGVIPGKYPLLETDSINYNKRTRLNVRDSDGTLIINRGLLGDGTAYTGDVAKRQDKPCLVVDVEDAEAADLATKWIERHAIKTLNVAGPREEKRPGIHDQAALLLRKIIRPE